MIKALFCPPLRMVTDFIQSLIKLSGLDWVAPDYSTLCRIQIAKHSQYHASHTSNYQEIQHQKEQQHRLLEAGKLGYTLFGWQGEQLAWESDLRVGLTAKTTHYIYEPDSVIPLVQVQYTQSIGLVTAPDYDKLIAQGYDIAQDPLWNHLPQLHRAVIEQIAYYHCDQLGTPQELTDRDGQLLWSAHYKAWGEAKVEHSERAKHLRIDNYHRYQGQYFDNETDLHYNPYLARYISRDPEQVQSTLCAKRKVKWWDELKCICI